MTVICRVRRVPTFFPLMFTKIEKQNRCTIYHLLSSLWLTSPLFSSQQNSCDLSPSTNSSGVSKAKFGCIARPKKLKEAAPPRESRLRRKKINENGGKCVWKGSFHHSSYRLYFAFSLFQCKPYVPFRCPVTRAARALGKAVAGTSDGSGGVFLCSWSYELLMSWRVPIRSAKQIDQACTHVIFFGVLECYDAS